MNFAKPLTVVLLFGLIWLAPATVQAHCDTFAGPVLIEAAKAMETGNVTPLLKWVKADREGVIKAAFTAAIRNRTTDAKAADARFFETLIRIHREGEGAPFTGIKPAGTELPAAIVAADKALEIGSSRELTDLLTRSLVRKIREKFDHARAKKLLADKSVAQGREYVAAYVDYVHSVEAIADLLASEGGHHHEGTTAADAQGQRSSCGQHGH